ncbi:hypothetical protein BT67DRAFT_443540 [Trichocladium antarcticum]|uniref:PD-(D/E)XK nuclease-like domain-containing protein n=1 Tax=Trichocladium antarcticum TaxID=1450529 RepID=A0AAN6UHB4_9PEZI|nr:hypothetical protein BT67DRAFT_443540 [Trichocladium antarcticum]
MHSHPALNATVEAWIDHIIKAGGQTVIMPDGPDSLPTVELGVTPRQPNKRQRQASTDFRNDDLETTPRPPLFCRDQTLSEVQSTSTADTNGTSRSGRSSPRKKEVALRRTLDWPIARVNITELKSVPAMLESLALDLKKIADGRQSLIPDIFRESMSADAGIFDQPHPDWFYTARDGQEELRAVHRQMRRICRNSLKCKDRMEYEAAWNDLVHCRVLEEALEGQDAIDFRNITLCRTLKAFHDDDPALRENKVDYGIFLQPARGGDGLSERLSDLASEGIDLTHLTLSDFAPTPLAISIETKTLQAKPIEGSVQLANWVRAHFRQLARVVERRSHGPGYQLPILPIIYVYGNMWRVDFAHRWDRKTMIYEGMGIGDTHTMYGCYQVCAAIRRLAVWVQEDFRRWWLRTAELPTSPNALLSAPSAPG